MMRASNDNVFGLAGVGPVGGAAAGATLYPGGVQSRRRADLPGHGPVRGVACAVTRGGGVDHGNVISLRRAGASSGKFRLITGGAA